MRPVILNEWGDESWCALNLLTPVVLRGAHVVLEPLAFEHHDDLVEAVADGRLWELWYTSVPGPDGVRAEIARRLGLFERGTMLPFAVVEAATGRAVGMTTFMNVDVENRRVEIGSTWYRAGVQRSGVNSEAKLLLLTHAFETLECIAVEFRTSAFNRRSRRAIERLGAKLDGVLRSHMLHADGTLRDTYVYSIVAAEWPAVRANLRAMLGRGVGHSEGQ